MSLIFSPSLSTHTLCLDIFVFEPDGFTFSYDVMSEEEEIMKKKKGNSVSDFCLGGSVCCFVLLTETCRFSLHFVLVEEGFYKCLCPMKMQ